MTDWSQHDTNLWERALDVAGVTDINQRRLLRERMTPEKMDILRPSVYIIKAEILSIKGLLSRLELKNVV